MPHVNSSGGDDLASSDEVKVYKDEGEEEKRPSENLSEDKLGLITETEEDKSSTIPGQNYGSSKDGGPSTENGLKSSVPHIIDHRFGPIGYVVTPYPYPNGANVPSSLGSKYIQPPHHGALTQLMMYSNEHFSPPPAHLGIPPVPLDPKTGIPRHPLYTLPGQFPPFYSPELSQVQWQPPGYPLTSGAFSRGPYPPSLGSSSFRYNPPGFMPPHPGLPGLHQPAIVTPGPKQEVPHSPHSHENHRHPHNIHDPKCNNNDQPETQEKKKPHIKKPLNAFMLFMKEQRAKVVAECTLKESAAINQILGRKWHALDRSEQTKYYEMARKEKELHQQLYPGWSARDNYASHNKKKKRKQRECLGEDCNNPKKCRARFGLDQQHQWCKPCRRKKKCIRFLLGDDADDDDYSNTDGEGPDSVPMADSTNDPENSPNPVHSSMSDDEDKNSERSQDAKINNMNSERDDVHSSQSQDMMPSTSGILTSSMGVVSST